LDKLENIDELKHIIEEYLKLKNVDLVDFIYRHEGRDLVLRVLVDFSSGGISLGECAQLNNEIGRIFDEKDLLPQGYVLEVSSPGLDRPLNSKKDFLRCLNKKVKFFFREQINGKFELEGVINKVEDNLVYIDIKGNIVEIPIHAINWAKQVV
jgi:ribosome maturation factor RimP